MLQPKIKLFGLLSKSMEGQMRKRANKRQQELLVERLHVNKEMARDNQAQPVAIAFWEELSNELNNLGCFRTAQQWQHIWILWVAKVKTKARKVHDTMTATGGGPAGERLSDVESKIMEIVGTACITGFGQQEAGMPTSVPNDDTSVPINQPPMLPSVQPEAEGASHISFTAPSPTVGQRRARARPRRHPRPHVNHDLISALNNNNMLLRETISTAVDNITAAMRDSSAATVRAAEILAAAIQSAGVPVFVQQDENNT